MDYFQIHFSCHPVPVADNIILDYFAVLYDATTLPTAPGRSDGSGSCSCAPQPRFQEEAAGEETENA